MTKRTKDEQRAQFKENGAALDWDWPGDSLALIDMGAARPRWRARRLRPRRGSVPSVPRSLVLRTHECALMEPCTLGFKFTS